MFVSEESPWSARNEKNVSQHFGGDGLVSLEENLKSRLWDAVSELSSLGYGREILE